MFQKLAQQLPAYWDRQTAAEMPQTWQTPTQTIDLNGLFGTDVAATASFDLRAVGSSGLGELLNALPIPAVLIDETYAVVFCNDASQKIGVSQETMYGKSLVDLLPSAKDTQRVAALTEKAISLLARTFKTRQPQRAEAILQIEQRRIWARLHLRTVRLGSQKQALVLIQDVTHEKTQERLSLREGHRLKEAYGDLEAQVIKKTQQIQGLRRNLDLELEQTRAEEATRVEKRKLHLLCSLFPSGVAFLDSNGTFDDMNRRFADQFGYEPEELPDVEAWLTKVVPDEDNLRARVRQWLRDYLSSEKVTSEPHITRAISKGGAETLMGLTLLRVEDSQHLMTCEDIGVLHNNC